MNTKLNQLQKIIEYNKRSPIGPEYGKLYDEFARYQAVYSDQIKKDPMVSQPLTQILLRHTYIQSVAFLQECVKKWVKHLVDSDFEYVSRISRNYRLDFDIHQISHFIDKKVTLGDFIAHNYLPNSLDELAKLYNVLIGKDIYVQFKYWYTDFNRNPGDYTYGELIESVKTCFKKRHIVAHELSPIEMENPSEPFKIAMGIILLVNSLASPKPDTVDGSKEAKGS